MSVTEELASVDSEERNAKIMTLLSRTGKKKEKKGEKKGGAGCFIRNHQKRGLE